MVLAGTSALSSPMGTSLEPAPWRTCMARATCVSLMWKNAAGGDDQDAGPPLTLRPAHNADRVCGIGSRGSIPSGSMNGSRPMAGLSTLKMVGLYRGITEPRSRGIAQMECDPVLGSWRAGPFFFEIREQREEDRERVPGCLASGYIGPYARPPPAASRAEAYAPGRCGHFFRCVGWKPPLGLRCSSGTSR